MALAGREGPIEAVDPDKFLTELAGLCRTANMRSQLQGVRQGAVGPYAAGTPTGCGNVAQHVAAMALAAFLRHPREPLRAIQFALDMGPHGSPAAVITAAIGAAANPHTHPPLPLVSATHMREQISAVAAGLAATAHAPRRQADRFVTQPS